MHSFIHSVFMYMCVLVPQSCPTLCDLMDSSPPASSVHEILQARILEVGSHSLLQGIFLTDPGIEPGSPSLQADSLPSEPLWRVPTAKQWTRPCMGNSA